MQVDVKKCGYNRSRKLSNIAPHAITHLSMTANTRELTPETLAALLERIAKEDAAALRELYDAAAPKLFGLALRILTRHEWAEEVLQDSFVNIWRFAGDYRRGLSAPMTSCARPPAAGEHAGNRME
jgi:hypothetical protein